MYILDYPYPIPDLLFRMVTLLIRKTNADRFRRFDDILSSLSRKWRKFYALVFLVNLITKVNLIGITISIFNGKPSFNNFAAIILFPFREGSFSSSFNPYSRLNSWYNRSVSQQMIPIDQNSLNPIPHPRLDCMKTTPFTVVRYPYSLYIRVPSLLDS